MCFQHGRAYVEKMHAWVFVHMCVYMCVSVWKSRVILVVKEVNLERCNLCKGSAL